MPDVKLVLADPESSKTSTYELKDDKARAFRGLKIGDKINGGIFGIDGEIKITGGSDRAGFPMRTDVLGGVKKHVLLTKGVGFRSKVQGMRKRKMVRGNTITDEIYQVNAVLLKKVEKEEKAPEPAVEAPREKHSSKTSTTESG